MIKSDEEINKSFISFWNHLKRTNDRILHSCGHPYYLYKRNGRLSKMFCLKCKRKSYGIIEFMREFVLTNDKYDRIFEGLKPNYKNKYRYILTGNVFSLLTPNDRPSTSNPFKKFKMIEDLPNSLIDESFIDKILYSREIIPDEIDEFSSENNQETVKISPLRPDIIEILSSQEKSKYNYKFKSPSYYIIKTEMVVIYLYGVKFKDSEDLMEFITLNSDQKLLVRAVFIYENDLVEIHLNKKGHEKFVSSMINISEFDFVSMNLDRVLRHLEITKSEFRRIKEVEYSKAYSKHSDKYIYKYLFE